MITCLLLAAYLLWLLFLAAKSLGAKGEPPFDRNF